MILIVAAAILGAAAGLYLRPRVLALAIALSLSGAIHVILGFVGRLAEKKPGYEQVHATLESITFLGIHGLWPVMAAAGTGTLLAALAWSVARKESTDGFWFPGSDFSDRRNGLRSMDMVEDRAIHAQARERLDAILKR
jgi:hypothetical protein